VDQCWLHVMCETLLCVGWSLMPAESCIARQLLIEWAMYFLRRSDTAVTLSIVKDRRCCSHRCRLRNRVSALPSMLYIMLASKSLKNYQQSIHKHRVCTSMLHAGVVRMQCTTDPAFLVLERSFSSIRPNFPSPQEMGEQSGTKYHMGRVYVVHGTGCKVRLMRWWCAGVHERGAAAF
jgi:hypothetical protein